MTHGETVPLVPVPLSPRAHRGLVFLTILTPGLCVLLQADAALQNLGELVILGWFFWEGGEKRRITSPPKHTKP